MDIPAANKMTIHRLTRINDCLLSLGTDFEKNIQRLTAICGELLKGTCALYNRLEDNILCSCGQWNTPSDYNPLDKPHGHICYDVILEATDDVFIVKNLPKTPYALTDPNVIPYKLQTYIGRVVRCRKEPVGSLCVVFQKDFQPDEEDKLLIGIIASVIGREEDRKKAEDSLKISEKNYREIFHSINDIIMINRIEDGKMIDFNMKLCEISGYSKEEIWDRSIGDMSMGESPYSQKEAMGLIKKAATEGPQIFEWLCKRKDGNLLWLEVNLKKTSIGENECMLGVAREITERKKEEKALKEERDRWKWIIECSPAIICGIGPDGRTILLNPAGEKITGYRQEEILGKNWWHVFYPGYEYEQVEKLFREFEKGEVSDYEMTLTGKDGKKHPLLWTSMKRRDCKGNLLEIIGMYHDITEIKKAQEEQLANIYRLSSIDKINEIIRKTEDPEEMMDLFLQAVIEIFKCDRAWLIYPCDPDAPSFRVLMERTRPEYKGAFSTGEDIPLSDELAKTFQIALASKEPVRYDQESEHIIPSEEAKHFNIVSQIHTATHPRMGSPWLLGIHQCSFRRVWKSEEVRLFKEISNRITDALSSILFLRDLRESEEKFSTAFHSSIALMALTTLEDGLFMEVNNTFLKTLGYTKEEVTDKTSKGLDLFVDYQQREDVIKSLKNNRVCRNVEIKIKTKNGDIRHGLFSAILISIKGKTCLLTVMNDITDLMEAQKEKKRLEERLMEAQKMEAIGTLAGGIAHDFNNILTAIQGHASLALMDINNSHPHFEHLRGIEQYVKSASDLTKQLLGFARGGKYEVIPVNLNELVKKSLEMFGRTRKEIVIYPKYGENLWVAEVDYGQIEQVMLNLYVNAWQAMPGGGELYVETQNIELDENHTSSFNLKPGRYIKISVTDTGIGMDEEIRQRIFDTFFTTREMGRGTGLGLASAYGIIKNHKGIIKVYSEKSEGTTFNIYLPASDKEIFTAKKIDRRILKGKGTLMLVDDEEMIIEVAKIMLQRLGYKVITATCGKEALRIYKEKMDEIKLVILDMIMPEMGGKKVYEHLKEINPDVKVLLSSGYSLNGEAQKILEEGCNGFIQKPYNITEMSLLIQNIS